MHDSVKLHLGCGEKYLEGYINIDYPPSEHTVMTVKADIYQDIRTLEYNDNSVDEIRNHHLFEHFPRAEALKLLADWRRWLKPGGKLLIETPDFEESARAYIWVPTRKRRMELGRHIFGRLHEGQVSQVLQGYNDQNRRDYFKNLASFKRKFDQEPSSFRFVDRAGNPI